MKFLKVLEAFQPKMVGKLNTLPKTTQKQKKTIAVNIKMNSSIDSNVAIVPNIVASN